MSKNFSGEVSFDAPRPIMRNMQRRGNPSMVQRHGGDATLTDPYAGLYNTWNNNANPLFDISVNDALIALAWENSLHPIFDILGFRNSILHKYDQGYITYVAASGTNAGTPTTGIATDPCAAGNTTEFGSATMSVSGFTRFRRTSGTFDITQIGMKYSERYPVFMLNGEMVTDDYAWAIMQLAQVQIQDMHEWLIDGDSAVSGETDGLINIFDGAAVDSVTSTTIDALSNYIINWNSSAIDSSTTATFSGARAGAIADGSNLWSILRDWLYGLQMRIRWSSLNANAGWELHVLTDPAMLPCLIESWICESICGGDPTSETARQMMDTMEARQMRDRMRQFMVSGSVPFDIDGVRVWFHAYPYGSGLNNGDGTYNFVGFVANVGGQQVINLDVKDMNAALDYVDSDYYTTSDNGRFLHFETIDKTCLTYTLESQMRLGAVNKWLGVKILNVACTNVFPFHAQPSNSYFLGTGNVNAVGVDYQPSTAQAVE